MGYHVYAQDNREAKLLDCTAEGCDCKKYEFDKFEKVNSRRTKRQPARTKRGPTRHKSRILRMSDLGSDGKPVDY